MSKNITITKFLSSAFKVYVNPQQKCILCNNDVFSRSHKETKEDEYFNMFCHVDYTQNHYLENKKINGTESLTDFLALLFKNGNIYAKLEIYHSCYKHAHDINTSLDLNSTTSQFTGHKHNDNPTSVLPCRGLQISSIDAIHMHMTSIHH
uniref:Uncharacterized protein n=1 Tax=Timema bartmani TaxID=61472 RepID=A0A7R9ERF8_9NEOP|nr:unnamed protein product [Timema bartmani]